MNERILIVEDEEVIQETLEYNLKMEEFSVRVTGNGIDAVKIAREWKPDIILLDVMLPGMSGFDVCKILRKETDIPILFLTARADEVDRVVGFEIGADDYIVKPFSIRELIARTRTRLRVYQQLQEEKKSSRTSKQNYVFGNLEVDIVRHETCLNGQALQLKPKEFDLLVFLVKNVGKALTRETILEQVWGWSYIGNDRTVDVHVRWLRQKIEQNPSAPKRIITIPGTGYRFEG